MISLEASLEKYDGLGLTPFFYSEVSSSYMIYSIFRNHRTIAQAFVKEAFGLDAPDALDIQRERNYEGKGVVDLILSWADGDCPVDVLIEVKVHDFLSATQDQIKTYFDAAILENQGGAVFFVYLTQFSRASWSESSSAALPDSIREFERSESRIGANKLRHLTWHEFHEFLRPFRTQLSAEEQLIVGLLECWMEAQIKHDLEVNSVEVGGRSVADFFGTSAPDVQNELPFGKICNRNNRRILEVDLAACMTGQHESVLRVIKELAMSDTVDKTIRRDSEAVTIDIARNFLGGLAANKAQWKLVTFYSSLFDFANSSKHVLLNGQSNFSIKVNVRGHGDISLCTLRTRKHILEFSLLR